MAIVFQRTDTKACVRLTETEKIDSRDFQLTVTLAEIHVPRMWVEHHPENSESHVSLYIVY